MSSEERMKPETESNRDAGSPPRKTAIGYDKPSEVPKLVAIFSPTGGIGTTLIAINIANHLSKIGKTCLIDLNLEFGMVAEYLNEEPLASLGSINAGTKFTPDDLLKLAHQHGEELKIFAAPRRVVDTVPIADLLDACRASFNYTVLDIPKSLLHPSVIDVLRSADDIMLVSEYNWAAIKNARAFIDQYVAAAQKQKLHVVMNNTEWLPKDVLSECGTQLNHSIMHELPRDAKNAKWSLNQGRFVPVHTLLGKSLESLASLYAQ